MQNIQEYFSQLNRRDRILLVFSLALLSFIILKFFLVDGLNKKNTKLVNKSTLIAQQEIIISKLDLNSIDSASSDSSNQFVSGFLKQKNASRALKQIRTTNDGSQRFELEDINFTTLVQLINFLDEKSLAYSNLQIRKTKLNGVVDATITMQ